MLFVLNIFNGKIRSVQFIRQCAVFYRKKIFMIFIIEICGETEANLIRIQGIQNVQSFIRCKDYFSILNIDCEEVDKLKSVACFRSRNGDYVVKQGVKLNFDNLADALKTKHEKFDRIIFESKQSNIVFK